MNRFDDRRNKDSCKLNCSYLTHTCFYHGIHFIFAALHLSVIILLNGKKCAFRIVIYSLDDIVW